MSLSWNAQAGTYFENLRWDQSIPSDCRETESEFFDHAPESFTASIQGAVHRGYDYEYPISRGGAAMLWRILKDPSSVSHQQRENAFEREPSLRSDLQVLQRHSREMGFDFGSEGEVLELLVIEDLKQTYPSDEFYITGSVEYHEAHSTRTIGELDVVIGKRSDCHVLYVGEVKLGLRSLGKAKQQMQRFISFYHRSLQHFFSLLDPFDLLEIGH